MTGEGIVMVLMAGGMIFWSSVVYLIVSYVVRGGWPPCGW